MVCCVPFALAVTVTVYVMGLGPTLTLVPEEPPPHAIWNVQAPRTNKTATNESSLLRRSVPKPAVPIRRPGINKPNAISMPAGCAPIVPDRDAMLAGALTVTVAVPVSFATEIAPAEQVGAGLAAGATAQVRVTPAGLKPFDGVIVTVDVELWPAEIEDGDNAVAEIAKSAVTLTAVELLMLKLPSPE